MSVWTTIKENNPITEFYKQFVKIDLNKFALWDELKREYFAKQLSSNTLYKFISFDNNSSLNHDKLDTLKNRCLWFAPHHVFTDNDPTEFIIGANIDIVEKQTAYNKEQIENLLTSIRDVNDICCLTDRISEYMWENYANNHSGICCAFEVIKTDDLWPVLYCKKDSVDFTYEVISGLNNEIDSALNLKTLAFISPILKDISRYSVEREVRLLNNEAYLFAGEPLNGILEPNKKATLHYFGRRVSWNSYGLRLKKIIIGEKTSVEIVNQIYKMSLNCIIENE